MTERFELVSQLGRGGMGTVWKARDSETGEVVALKLLHQIYVDDPDYVARFEREVEIAQRISSPFVVEVLGFGRREGTPFVAMEYVEGKSLRDRLRAEGPVGWDEAKRIAIQVATALSAAHAAGVIHRDIKPSNVLLDGDGNVKLADFGIARATDLTRMTGSVTVLGTPAYMSPDGDANEQSDLYALGCELYELMAGVPPFEGDSQQQVLLKHIREAPNLERLPTSARRIVGWLLEKDPKRRPVSAEALLAVLQGSSIRGTGAVVPPRPPRRTGRWVAAGFMSVAGLGLAGVVAFAVAAFLGGGDSSDDDDEAAGIFVASPTPEGSRTSAASGPATGTATAPRTPSATASASPTPTITPTATGSATLIPTPTPTMVVLQPTSTGSDPTKAIECLVVAPPCSPTASVVTPTPTATLVPNSLEPTISGLRVVSETSSSLTVAFHFFLSIDLVGKRVFDVEAVGDVDGVSWVLARETSPSLTVPNAAQGEMTVILKRDALCDRTSVTTTYVLIEVAQWDGQQWAPFNPRHYGPSIGVTKVWAGC